MVPRNFNVPILERFFILNGGKNMINIKENEKLSIMNHSCAHLMAQAVKHLYPNALFWVGPVIESGFYYDIDLGSEVIKEEDLLKIEKEILMKIMMLKFLLERKKVIIDDKY